jgi:anion-transporting  ArsA/GET3 family ATPase
MKPLTLPELYEKLLALDEVTFLEVLEINTEELIEAFKDKIDEQADKLERLFDDNEYDE